MRTTNRAFALFLVSLLTMAAAAALAQGVDTEPNNTCATAQEIGAVGLPYVVDGNLDPVGDIDFYGFTGVPGEVWVVRHEGEPNGSGTLGDPLLGIFDSACSLIVVNDDSGTLNSRAVVTVPADGRIVVAATAYPDFEFVGYGEGTYRLTVEPFVAIGTIGGRLVDGDTGDPLPGSEEPYAYAELSRCDDFGNCFDFVAYEAAGPDGRFLFAADYFGNPLGEGTYQVRAFAYDLYESYTTAPFFVAGGESVDLGDLALPRIHFIGSVSGRLIDALDSQPLPGDRPPFAYLYAKRCEGPWCEYLGFATPDADGRFHIDGLEQFLRTGTYEIEAYATDYFPATSARMEIGEGEDVDFGDLALAPFPIQFGEVQTCTIPAQGGVCRYGIEIRNRGQERFSGETWSQVFAFGIAGPAGFTSFQTGRVGTVNPKPEKVDLKPDETVQLAFELNVPGTVPDYATFCATALVGQDPDPLFNVLGERFLFCVSKEEGVFVNLSEKEGRKRLRELRKESRH